MTSVKAAVIYYGSATVPQFRLDLPVLFVRAGLDRPGLNEAIATLATRAIGQNAPFTLQNYAGGHHGFEAVDNNDTTRRVIDETLNFVINAASAPYQAALRASLGEAAAAGYVQSGKLREAAAEYARMVAARPDDARLRLAYGEALLGDASSRRPARSSTSCGTRDWATGTWACRRRAPARRRGTRTRRSRG